MICRANACAMQLMHLPYCLMMFLILFDCLFNLPIRYDALLKGLVIVVASRNFTSFRLSVVIVFVSFCCPGYVSFLMYAAFSSKAPIDRSLRSHPTLPDGPMWPSLRGGGAAFACCSIVHA